VFYSVIETRDFSLFNQSAQALLKGYFINTVILMSFIAIFPSTWHGRIQRDSSIPEKYKQLYC
jgi:hypothetical protein